jgi:energy-coupling factor transporter ATP-binding protein EcfA2
MVLSAADFSGRVTFVTGPEKGSGKTTLLNYALGLLRAESEAPAFLGIGFDGEAGTQDARAPRVACRPGEVFVSAERYLRSSSCLPELLEALPGETALGKLAVARARRPGQVVLVGPERNEYSAWAIDAIRAGGWARTVLVDGAMNRITQISALSGPSAFPLARFLFAMRVAPGDLERNVKSMKRIFALSRLPVAGGAGAAAGTAAGTAPRLPGPVYRVEGPLTAQTLARVPEGAASVVVEDFTKVFLDSQALAAFVRSRPLAVERGFEFGGFVVSLRDLTRERFSAALGDGAIEDLVEYDPYEAHCA